jgi:hypothetical protein
MKTTTASLVALLIPAALSAQVSGQASASTVARVNGASVAGTASTSASGEFRAPGDFSAAGAAKLDAMYAEAKEHHVPREPMASRVAEGQAKGASEATIIASAGRVKANLEATHDAMVAGGRMHPSDDECTRGASAMERGVTKVQIEGIAKSTQGDRSLVVAFDVLGKLAASGMPVNQAVAQVQQNVSSGASDATLVTLTTNGSAAATAGAAGSANAAAGATAAGTASAAAKPVGGTLTTAVSGVIKKP